MKSLICLIKMIKSLLNLLELLGLYNNNSQTKSNNSESEFKPLEKFNKRGEILIHDTQKVEKTSDFDEIVKYTSNTQSLTQKELINTITINISFLERLMKKLENSIYIHEYSKVKEMLKQSKTCKQIIKNISNNQIFYQKTIEVIRDHTIIIAKLVNDVNKLDI